MKTRLKNRLSTALRTGRTMPRLRTSSARMSPAPVGFRRILVAVDFSAGWDKALRHTAALARAHRARVLPLHITPPICFTVDCGYGPVNRQMADEHSLQQTRVRLQRLVHRFVPAKLTEDVTVRSGEPIGQIVTVAKEWKADLIVMLAHGMPGTDSTCPTHTVDRLVREVRCPVLVLHAQRPVRRSRVIRKGTAYANQ
jgi:nucleotide-binding universal stress UspA family protein